MSGRDFLRGLDMADEAVRRAAREGMAKAGMQLMTDAVTQVPRVPVDEGTLRGSGSVFVDGKLAGIAPNVGGDPTPATGIEFWRLAQRIVATVGFNTPYAARLHEHPQYRFGYKRAEKAAGKRHGGSLGGMRRFYASVQRGGTGGRFLISKMVQNRDRYFQTIARHVASALRG